MQRLIRSKSGLGIALCASPQEAGTHLVAQLLPRLGWRLDWPGGGLMCPDKFGGYKTFSLAPLAATCSRTDRHARQSGSRVATEPRCRGEIRRLRGLSTDPC